VTDGGWWVYVVRCDDDTYYCGIARDVERRVAQHNAGRGARYTRGRRPVVLIYQEPVPSQRDALKRERVIKGWPKRRKAALAVPGTDG
jgi:predicted GIY-YIG superfamily endonuclease